MITESLTHSRWLESQTMNHSQITSFIWSAVDLIRDTFKRGIYQDVILGLTVLRRIDRVPDPTGFAGRLVSWMGGASGLEA